MSRFDWYVHIRWLVIGAFAVGCVAFLSGGWMVGKTADRSLTACRAELAKVKGVADDNAEAHIALADTGTLVVVQVCGRTWTFSNPDTLDWRTP